MSMNNEYELVMIITTFYQVPDIRVLSTGSFVLPNNCMRKYYKSHVEKGAPHQEKGQLVWLGSGSMGGRDWILPCGSLTLLFAHWC